MAYEVPCRSLQEDLRLGFLCEAMEVEEYGRFVRLKRSFRRKRLVGSR
jgi:hypothetical protein